MKGITMKIAPWIALSCLVALSSLAVAQQPAPADAKKETIVIQFKIFDANRPTEELKPNLNRKPIILLRNLDTLDEELFLGNKDTDISIVESKERKGFYEIVLPKGRLINDMAIDVEQANTNPGAVIKVVTANNIVVYPGASSSVETFSMNAYAAQLGRYGSLLAQLTEAFPGRKDEIRGVLINRYGHLLMNMKGVLDNNQVRFTDPSQAASARKTLNETLVAYGLMAPEAPVRQQVAQHVVVHQQVINYRRCRWRCR